MGERRAVTVAAVLWCTAATVVLVGCTPEAAPTPLPLPTATGFASDEEAFAAAEATYRAYVDAVNARRADPDAPDPNNFLAGAAREASTATQRKFASQGVRLVGKTLVTDVDGVIATTEVTTIHVCIDSAGTRLIDSAGDDVTPRDRPRSGSLEIDLTLTVDRLFIVDSREGSSPC